MVQEGAKKSLGPRVVLVLRTLCHLNKSQRKALLKTADKNIVRGICECILNILHGVVNLSKQKKSKLKKYKKVLQKLIDVRKKSKKSWKSKKRLIVQKGEGFVPYLLGPLLSTL